jgi:uncharacterized protein (DUF1810 family)
MGNYWEFKESRQWNVMGQNPSKEINENIRKGFKYFTIEIKGNNYKIHINPDNETGYQKNLTTGRKLSIKLSNKTFKKSSSVASAWGGQPSSTQSISRGRGASALGGIGTQSISRGRGASAWGGQPSSNEKSAIDLNNMIEHCNARFTCLHIMLLNNDSLEIIIPSDDSKTTNMGKGRAINQWTNKTNKIDYETFINHLDKKIDELHKMYSSRVSFGRLIKNLDEPNRIQLWGANLQNYDNRASKGNIIEGSGQAEFLQNHTQSTYGIITTPLTGVPQQGTNDFNFERFLSRNDIDNFKPSTKINVPKRKVQQFIDDLKEASRRKGGYKLAKKELTKGEKKGHWFWYVFPQPLNIYDKLGISASIESQKYCFNSKEEAFAFIEDNELRQKYFNCLQLILGNKEKSIRDIMGIDTDKFITSVNHIKLTLIEYEKEHGIISQKGYVTSKTMLQYIGNDQLNPGSKFKVGKLYKRSTNKKKSNKKKSNKKKSKKKSN